jgi:hypothetical protein
MLNEAYCRIHQKSDIACVFFRFRTWLLIYQLRTPRRFTKKKERSESSVSSKKKKNGRRCQNRSLARFVVTEVSFDNTNVHSTFPECHWDQPETNCRLPNWSWESVQKQDTGRNSEKSEVGSSSCCLQYLLAVLLWLIARAFSLCALSPISQLKIREDIFRSRQEPCTRNSYPLTIHHYG